MPGNPLALTMLDSAMSDVNALANMLDSERFDDRVFGFHAQQAVEKALKAWLLGLGHSHSFTHDLSLLLHELKQAGVVVHPYAKFLDLTSYAVRFRYDQIPIDDEPLDRTELLDDVQALAAHVAVQVT